MTIRFIAEIIPHGKERARQALRNGYVHSYTPKKTVEFERAIAWAYKAAYRGAQMPQDAPLSINVTSYIPIPKSAPKRLRELYASERTLHPSGAERRRLERHSPPNGADGGQGDQEIPVPIGAAIR